MYRINDPEENDSFVIDLDFELVIGLVGRSGEVQHVPGKADFALEIDHGPFQVSDVQARHFVDLAVTGDELQDVLPETLLADHAKGLLNFVSGFPGIDHVPEDLLIKLRFEVLPLGTILG